MKRKSYVANFPTNLLFPVLEQNQKELLKLEWNRIEHETKELKDRIKQVELTISLVKNTIINRYLEENISFTKVARLLCKSTGIQKEIYQELFVAKIMNTNELISVDLLNQAISCLDLDQIMKLMRNQDKIYSDMVESRFDELIYDVDQEVYENYLEKERKDKNEYQRRGKIK